MSDIVDAATRSRMMAGIRGKDTSPELTIRRMLHRLGFRYRLHDRRLPGRPDLVFANRRAVIFIHGCFWHGHACPLFRWPATRPEFWRSKIEGNRTRDARAVGRLHADGWRCLTIWECALKGTNRLDTDKLAAAVAIWLAKGRTDIELQGLPSLR